MLPAGRLLTCITYELSASTMGFYAATCSSLSEPRPRYLRRRCGVLQTRTSRRQLRHFSGSSRPKEESHATFIFGRGGSPYGEQLPIHQQCDCRAFDSQNRAKEVRSPVSFFPLDVYGSVEGGLVIQV
jgi:hypothetical protein